MNLSFVSKKTRVVFQCVLVALVCGLSTNGTMAENKPNGHYTDTVTPNGHADWTAGTVTARGVGVPPKNSTSKIQEEEMARKAAWTVALSNLLEVVHGVYVDSTTTVNNYVTSNAEVRTKVEGFVKGARLLKEERKPDGSYETTVEMKLAGEFSNTLLPKLERGSTIVQPKQVPTKYTGLVVDARGLGARPALAPRILTEEGKEAYSVRFVKQREVAEQGIAVYVPDEPSAQAHPRVTNAPLKIKAIRAQGKQNTDLVIRTADAQTVHGVRDHLKFLDEAKVLIILDQQ